MTIPSWGVGFLIIASPWWADLIVDLRLVKFWTPDWWVWVIAVLLGICISEFVAWRDIWIKNRWSDIDSRRSMAQSERAHKRAMDLQANKYANNLDLLRNDHRSELEIAKIAADREQKACDDLKEELRIEREKNQRPEISVQMAKARIERTTSLVNSSDHKAVVVTHRAYISISFECVNFRPAVATVDHCWLSVETPSGEKIQFEGVTSFNSVKAEHGITNRIGMDFFFQETMEVAGKGLEDHPEIPPSRFKGDGVLLLTIGDSYRGRWKADPMPINSQAARVTLDNEVYQGHDIRN